MMKFAFAAVMAVGLAGCGIAHADRINGLTRQELARESDRSICHPFVNSSAAMAERQARGLGDCSYATVRCREMGYPVGHPQYLSCRQTLAAEAAAAAAAAPRQPTICNQIGNTVICN